MIAVCATTPRRALTRYIGYCAGGAVAVALLVNVGPTAAEPTQETELAALLRRLEASACSFGRNGSWYSAAEASRHLALKWRHVSKSGMPDSAEQFIELAGSRSSETGAAYLVRCPGAPALPAAAWLREQLAVVRLHRSH